MMAKYISGDFLSQRRQLVKLSAASASLGLLGAFPSTSFGEEKSYPNKPIRFVVPFTPGGSTDIIARSIGQQLTEAWGQPVIVDNVSGAGGSIGADKVAKSTPDGYTLLVGHVGTLAVTPSLYPKLPYDARTAFAAVAWLARVPNVLVVHPSIPARNVKELVDYLKGNPNKINYGSAGNGSAAHIAMEYFKLQSGTKVQHVPYRGTAPAVTDLIAGQIQIMFTGIPAVIGQLKNGQLRAIAVSSLTRVKALPNLPTVSESGYPGFEADQWYGIVAPAATPRGLIDKLNQQINKSLGSPALTARFANEGAEATPNPPLVFEKLMKDEINRWGAVINEAKIKVD